MSEPSLPPLVMDLLHPGAYPHAVEGVRLVQTHISYVLLTGGVVYKIKKPVNFGFLDYTTLEKRRYFCHEELRLNRRLSPEVYLEVVEIRRDASGRHHVAGEGEVVEYAVAMRELPQDAALSARLAAGGATRDMIERLARLVAEFHLSAATNEEIASFGSLERVKFSIDENFSQTTGYIGRTMDQDDYAALKDYSGRFMAEKTPLFAERVALGKIRDCHGDLHTQNVYFTNDEIHVLDGIEFNRRFRFLDTTADLAFLLMDLDFRGFPGYANRLLNTYLQFTNDYHLLGLLDFYRTYRAYVWGKIASFEYDMPELERSRREEVRQRAGAYFRLARGYIGRRPKPPVLATVGVIGSGKSYMARRLAERLGAVVVRSDAVRKILAGASPTDSMRASYGAGIYGAGMTDQVYAEMLRQAGFATQAGWPVVLDATYGRAKQREAVARFAEQGGWSLLFVHCGCQDAVIMERLLERSAKQGVSDAGPELMERMRADFEPLEEPAVTGRVVRVSDRDPENERMDSILRALEGLGVRK
ncbi:MAG: AAA family ATPase [Pseudomonadota bacterium]